MRTITTVLIGSLFCAVPVRAEQSGPSDCDVVKPRVMDQLSRVTLNQQELGGELHRRIRNLVNQHFMVIDLDANWLNHFRHRTDRGDRQYVYYGLGKVIDAGSLLAAYTGDPQVAARTQYLIDELVRSRDADGYVGFWNVEPENRQDHINWILHEQEYINLALVRHYRCLGDPRSLAHARVMGDHILQTFPTPQNPCYDAGEICTAGLPEGMLELYRVTGDQRYLDFAADVPHGNNRGEIQLASLRTWEQDFSRRPCHVYVMLARCYAQTELYRLTGEEPLLHMSRYMRNELLKQGAGGLLVTGSCSEGEHFTYNQNGRGAIGESCVTAYMLRWIDSLLRLEGDLRYGDLLERAIYNALFAANSPDGRWIRYFTPFTGDRTYDTRDSFCCCGNYRRAVAELPQKVYYRTPEGGVALNLFTNAVKTFDVRGQPVTIRQDTAYPSDGEVQVTLATERAMPFAFVFRTPRWCERITVRVNDEASVMIDSRRQALGRHVIERTWKDGDAVHISLPMEWRFLRGRAVQAGRVALMRGPLVYCLGKDQNADLFTKCPDPRSLVLDPASLAKPVRDDSIRPGGWKAVARAWLNQDRTGEQVQVVLTEFIDPSGQEVYFQVPDPTDTSPVRLEDDELVTWPNEFANAHVIRALYGPPGTVPLASLFETRGDTLADLAADYVHPGGTTGLPAEFADATGGHWGVHCCGNQGLLSTAGDDEVRTLNSQCKAFGTPPGYAYGLDGQSDELGFVANHMPSDRQEDSWRVHYTEGMFDRVLAASERSEFLYTHPVADPTRYHVFRWTPSDAARKQDITLQGTLFSNLGNGVECRVIRWDDDARHQVLGTFNTRDGHAGQCGTVQFELQLPQPSTGRHVDFVLHNAGAHICDATALRIRAYTNVQRAADQLDVTARVREKFRNHLVTPLGSYDDLFGDATPSGNKTLKLKLHYWQDGDVRYYEFPKDAVLDLAGHSPVR
jgi:hypothetical protein